MLFAEVAIETTVLDTINSTTPLAAVGALIWLVKHWQSVTLPHIVARHSESMQQQREDFLTSLSKLSDQYGATLAMQVQNCKDEQDRIHAGWQKIIDHYLTLGGQANPKSS